MTHIGHSEKVLFMRIFLSVLILIFGLQSWTKADDIRDFQIEGISIGDSLLEQYKFEVLIEELKKTKFHIHDLTMEHIESYISEKIIYICECENC